MTARGRCRATLTGVHVYRERETRDENGALLRRQVRCLCGRVPDARDLRDLERLRRALEVAEASSTITTAAR